MNDKTYSGKLQEPIICETVNEYKQIFEPDGELIDTLLSEKSIRKQEKHLAVCF